MPRHSFGWLVSLAVAASACGGAQADDQDVTEKRVKELFRVIELQELGGRERRDAASAAMKELIGMGEPIAPLLVEAGATGKYASYAHGAADLILTKMGKGAAPAIRSKWGDLNDEQRWRFMPLLEKHDPDSVRAYARNCLDCKDEDIQIKAWHSVLLAKDEKVKDRYFDVLEGKRDVPDRVRWLLLPKVQPLFDEERENSIGLTQLLLVAVGSGVVRGIRGWPRG